MKITIIIKYRRPPALKEEVLWGGTCENEDSNIENNKVMKITIIIKYMRPLVLKEGVLWDGR